MAFVCACTFLFSAFGQFSLPLFQTIEIQIFSLVWLFIRMIRFGSVQRYVYGMRIESLYRLIQFSGRHFFEISCINISFSDFFLLFLVIYVNINSTFIISRFNIANFFLHFDFDSDLYWDCVGSLSLVLSHSLLRIIGASLVRLSFHFV